MKKKAHPAGDLSEIQAIAFNRRSFLRNSVVAGTAVTVGTVMLESIPVAEADSGPKGIGRGDAAILRFLAAAEKIIESDLWLQYNELGGVQDDEVSTIASNQIPGYPGARTGGNTGYTNALTQLDGDMPQYISDTTEDKLSHETFINAYLISKGADPVNLDRFRTVPRSTAFYAMHVSRTVLETNQFACWSLTSNVQAAHSAWVLRGRGVLPAMTGSTEHALLAPLESAARPSTRATIYASSASSR